MFQKPEENSPQSRKAARQFRNNSRISWAEPHASILVRGEEAYAVCLDIEKRGP